jgi:hypothetical protein
MALLGEVTESGPYQTRNFGQQVTICYRNRVDSGENHGLVDGHARMHRLQQNVGLLRCDAQATRHEIADALIWFLLDTAFTQEFVYTLDRFCTNHIDEMRIGALCFLIHMQQRFSPMAYSA